MTGDADKLLEEALRLPDRERLRLAERLLASLDGEPDPDAAEAWDEEIARRSREIEEGPVESILWPEVKETAQKARGAS
jgi:putative addiction module component (TIGR02574 family)